MGELGEESSHADRSYTALSHVPCRNWFKKRNNSLELCLPSPFYLQTRAQLSQLDPNIRHRHPRRLVNLVITAFFPSVCDEHIVLLEQVRDGGFDQVRTEILPQTFAVAIAERVEVVA